VEDKIEGKIEGKIEVEIEVEIEGLHQYNPLRQWYSTNNYANNTHTIIV
jgi:hypothetical protein